MDPSAFRERTGGRRGYWCEPVGSGLSQWLWWPGRTATRRHDRWRDRGCGLCGLVRRHRGARSTATGLETLMERLRRTRARLETRLAGLPDDATLHSHLEITGLSPS